MPCGIRFRVGRNKWFPGIFRTYRASRLEVDDRAHPDPSVVPRRGAALLVVGGVVVHAAAAEAPTATPIPDSAGRGFAVSGSEGVLELGAWGYDEHEYLLSGTAATHEQLGLWTSDGRWSVRQASEGTPYTTCMVVVRPDDSSRFNGTVVEWLNVSFDVDTPVDFSQSYRNFMREGYIYIGLTTQKRALLLYMWVAGV